MLSEARDLQVSFSLGLQRCLRQPCQRRTRLLLCSLPWTMTEMTCQTLSLKVCNTSSGFVKLPEDLRKSTNTTCFRKMMRHYRRYANVIRGLQWVGKLN